MAVVTADTLVGLLRERAGAHPDRVALREKEFGIWQRVTWADYLGHVRRTALGLRRLGLEPGDNVAILSENRREWLYAELGAIAAGGRAVGVYPTSPAPEVRYVVDHSLAPVVVCEDQEQTDKILEESDRLPRVRHIVVMDPKGLRNYTDPRILTFDDLERLGAEEEARDPGRFEALASAVQPDDVAIIIYTSGTTGHPKGAMITHRNILAMTRAMVEACEIVASDSVVSYLPLCHVAEQIFSVFLSVYLGVTVNFAESIRTIQADLREIAPTVFLGVPRIWEKLQSSIVIGVRDAPRWRQRLFRACLAQGYRLADKRLAREPWSALDRLTWWACYGLMFRALQNYVGLRKARFCFSAASAISPEVLRFFHAIGIRVKEGYGMTESSGLSFIHMGDDIRLGTVGRVVPGLEFRIAPDGELLKRGEQIFAGYFRDPEATRQTVDEDGWLHTGDIAELDEHGHLRIVDRKKAILITAGGKNIAPSEIENALKVSPYIKEAVVLGEGERFIAALIQIDYDTVGKWATERKVPYTNFKSLARRPEVRELIAAEVDRANQGLARVKQVREFRLLEKELDHDDDEVTATMKVRRRTIYEKYADLIQEIYGGKG
ncbi:MAG: long-chain fatty acid--CoA ligase [Deltaproteobacteria bacterium]|nr:long-chain fatty acid--CoA ligase [Deltaproteobacteria bacterium]